MSLPKGWKVEKLGEVGKVCMCKRIYKKQTTEAGDIPFYKIGTFGKQSNAFISNDLYKEFKSKYSFPKKGEILISASGTIGRRVIYDGRPAYFQDSNIVWLSHDESKILNIYLYQFYGYCNWNPSKGATISRLYNDDFRSIPIPIPPLAEQKKIVAILDKAFAAIDEAKANTEQNIVNAKEIFQSRLDEIFSNPKKGWKIEKLGDVCERIFAGGDVPKGNLSKERTTKFTVPIYSNGKKNDGLYGYTDIEKVKVDSISISARGTIGYTSLRKAPFFPVVRLVVVVPNSKSQDLEYLYYFIHQQEFTNSGTSIPQLTVPMVKEYDFCYPPVAEQKKIVAELDKLRAATDEMVENYEQKLEDLEELRKSMLERAFLGELT